ncbi:MAG: esterase [Deltaproteobacteria bacterium]|nr:MAG: esterase [Deltaproteobacteria bacterium]
MERRTFAWHSPALDREMRIAAWGHFGRPVVLFATAASDELDYERFKLIHVLKPLMEAGRIKVYSVSSVAGEGWLSKDAHPGHKSWLQHCYDRYLGEEAFPAIAEDCGGFTHFVTAGASIGAYNAVTALLKHPDYVDLAIGMSGTYDFDRWMHGHRDEFYYFNQPMYFVPNLPEGALLDELRTKRVVLATGQGRAEAPDESRRMSQVLDAKGIPNDLEIWGKDVHHDWPTWRTMLPMFLDRLV